jgi:hypothetical protein
MLVTYILLHLLVGDFEVGLATAPKTENLIPLLQPDLQVALACLAILGDFLLAHTPRPRGTGSAATQQNVSDRLGMCRL